MHVSTGLAFAKAIVANEYDKAYKMLSSELQNSTTALQLETEFNEMIAYAGGKFEVDGFYHEMTDWPGKLANDIGWVYVSLSGEAFAEAVTLIVTSESGSAKIRDIEWGRP